MRVKQGDLAVIVHSRCPSNIGTVVRVLDRYAHPAFPDVPFWSCQSQGSPVTARVWAYADGRPVEMWRQPARRFDCPDAWLRPLRDEDGVDETLLVAGRPREAA